jgi:phosphohistidine phosphatase
MNLYLIRHAQAEVAEPGQRDAERKLTLKGLEQAKTLRKTLEHLEVKLDVVFTSPWRRARQTSSALEPVADHLEVLELLAAAPKPALVKRINEMDGVHASVALVGHQPWMSELTSLLLTGKPDFASSFEYRKCALYALEFTPAQCFLRFVLPSGVLKRLS